MADTTTWTPITAPTDFRDDAVFDIDFKTKTVQVLVEQPIVAGENLSQFIKFQAPRFYDNIDLTNMSVNILYVSPAGNKGISAAINTEYSDDMIRCGWLVPYAACPEKGTLLFVLEFVGADYVLKTTIGSTPVLDSINDADVIPEPVEQTWYITLQANVSAALQEAQTALGRIESIFNALSAPMSASTAVDMVDESAIYVYTGSETGYTYGNWYYYDGSAWVSGGKYASTALVTDRTLSQSGQASDAKVVGDRLNGLDETLLRYNTFNILQKIGTFTDASTNGVDFAWSDNGSTLTITGTSTKLAARNIYYKLNGLPFGIEAGKTYYFNAKRSGDGTGLFQIYYYSGSSNITADVVNESRYITIPENADGLLIRAAVYSGQLGDVVFSDIGLFLQRTNTVVNPSNQYKDVAGIVNKELESNGLCILGPGVFFVTHIDMPENSALIGSGPQTKIILMGSDSTEGYAIKMASRCTVSNMSILGSDADHTSNDSAYPKTKEYVNRHGILWEGNYSSGGTNIQRRGMISNCYIANFSGGGITCRDNGMNVISGVNVTDCIIWYCYAGIYIPYVAEFNRFENVVASNCYYGAVNNGGNNCFSNCNFSKNVVGFLIDNSSGQSPNNGHGSVSNCIFDHSDGNTGIGIHLIGVTPGEVFVGCQLFYSQIVIENSNGVNFIGLNAGWAEKISVTGGLLVMFNDCVFRTHPDVTIDNNDIVKFTNCYTYDGTPVEKN